MPGRRQRVVILGGGMAGLTAAWELSRTPALRDRFEVAVYQRGHRLGGKLASSRQAAQHERSLEHGLHVWFGFYDNAFALLREAYQAWVPPLDCPITGPEQAFLPVNRTHVGSREGGHLHWWFSTWPENQDRPGDGRLHLSPWGAICQAMGLFRVAVQRMLLDQEPELPDDRELAHAWDREVSGPETHWRPGRPVLWLLDRIVEQAKEMGEKPRRGFSSLRRLLWLFDKALRGAVEPLTESNVDTRNLLCLMDVATAFFTGLLNPDYGITRDWDLGRIDHLEFRDWLIANGGDPDVVNHWSGVRAVYDTTFHYDGGDAAKPSFAAGAAARVIIRVTTQYNGAVLYHLASGAGETVISPLYEVLRARGVRFHFFHDLQQLELSSDSLRVERVHLNRQVEVRGETYEPLRTVKGLRVWDDRPDWSQLAAPDEVVGQDLESHWATASAGRTVLEHGPDFDHLVLAVSLGSLMEREGEESPAKALIEARSEFRWMVEAPPLVPSVAVQLWMRQDAETMGWSEGTVAMVGLQPPLRIWADMSHLLPTEEWERQPGSLHYFCGPIGVAKYLEKGDLEGAMERARRSVGTHLSTVAPAIWPKTAVPGEDAPWRKLSGGPIVSSYLRLNLNPTDCVVASPPGGVKARLRADESGFANLVLAGAWTRNGIDASCVEAAVMSGMQAARAIHGQARRVIGESFMQADWPTRPPLPEASVDEGSVLPRYVERIGHGMQVVEPPGVVTGAAVYAFALQADGEALQALVDRNLTEPTGGAVQHRVISDHVLLSFMDADGLSSTAQRVGWIPDREAAFWVPVMQRRRGGLPRLGFWLPYVFVDSSIAMATGREIWGIWKELAGLSFPSPTAARARFRIMPTVFPELDPRTMGRASPIVVVERKGGLEPDQALDDLSPARDALLRLLLGGGDDAAAALGDRLEDQRVPLIGLKQFRDAARPQLACYQSLVRATCTIRDVHGVGRLPGPWTVKLEDVESHRIRQDLGLGLGTLTATTAGWVHMDFSIDLGEELWAWSR